MLREIAPLDFPPMEPEAAFDPPGGTLVPGATNGSTARTETPTPSPKPEKPATAPPMPDTPSSVAANTNKPKSSPIAADDSAQISISDGGEVPTPYITLEAAVADAKDGGTIELKFNGIRAVSEKPFRISGKRVTIRAGAAITR